MGHLSISGGSLHVPFPSPETMMGNRNHGTCHPNDQPYISVRAQVFVNIEIHPYSGWLHGTGLKDCLTLHRSGNLPHSLLISKVLDSKIEHIDMFHENVMEQRDFQTYIISIF